MTNKSQNLPAYMVVTAAYWAFMLTDGALRILVLLHFHILGFSPIQLAYLFVLYEIAGIVTNLTAGWVAARFGLVLTLNAGLFLQIIALLGLSQLNAEWGITTSVIYAMCIQGLSGIAKDLTKMSSKSAVKLLAPDENSSLFKWVAVLTGAKNAIKGLGCLIGAASLGLFGFVPSVLGLAAMLTAVLASTILRMPKGLPSGIKGTRFAEVFSTSPQVNRLSVARIFLIGARDVWFVVGVPIYFYTALSDGTDASDRIAFFSIGAFMAFWTILYGAVQAKAPALFKSKHQGTPFFVSKAEGWVRVLIIPLVIVTLFSVLMTNPSSILSAILVAGLFAFGAVFAINSSLHSFLILAFTTGQRVTMDVGFYYMANATGRLVGTLLSGISYQIGGLSLCLATATVMLILSWIATKRLEQTLTL
ncbi:MAG: organoarsenical effux MFS transporter ArsJ [Paracoccaceae bacterium]|nr:organoarsenical effux MFS transporter ArsJ [Paracoccaceae bacterium]MDG1736328.1 organoarsenical effux MFS transporter ArsJ [Paracoccaceae bacterium]MDG2257875.1 organoarsenical effux MFS transporter ArsJ [Paracoccaceae bacterium]